MKIIRLIIILLILALFGIGNHCSAIEMENVLEDHDPLSNTGTGPSSSYTVKSGDTLWDIAQKLLGDGNRYLELIRANEGKYPSLANHPNLISAGWQLEIPGGNETSPSGNSATPTLSSSNVPAPRQGASGGKALLGWLEQAGLSGTKLRTAWAIGMAESRGIPSKHNTNSRTKDNSYGLFQINMYGRLGPSRLRQYGLKSNEDLFDPMVNIRIMLKMSNNGTSWRAWGAYTNGSYKSFLNQFPPR
ncbi:MAG: LysM peptidoglycan-binding domain-containing protein [Candidatus Riflebacteria bacterium]|nr:LysM peptidoglycan-binding domain-containing protein [Candidatus Riflebacteria bacterium]